jgi:hypothetical protein
MNINCKVEAGGIFSKYMICIQNILSYDFENIENIKISNLDKRLKLENPFDYVYDTNKECFYDIDINCRIIPSYQELHMSKDLIKLKKINSKFKLKNSLFNKVNEISDDLKLNKTLGVHIRLTDMNIYHKMDYGYFDFDDYRMKIDSIMENGDYNNIFVASDNYESISKLINIYGDKILFYKDAKRVPDEKFDTTSWIIENFSKEKHWTDAYIDMLLLSRCSGLLYRVSNFVNASMIYSDNIKEFYKLKK